MTRGIHACLMYCKSARLAEVADVVTTLHATTLQLGRQAHPEVKGGGLLGGGLLVVDGEGEVGCSVVVGLAAGLVHADVLGHARVLRVLCRPLVASH